MITAGVAATVTAQGQSEPKKRAPDPAATSSPAPGRKPVFQYEIRILKDGAPITPTMKLAAQVDIPSEFEIPEGTVELRFRPREASLKNKAPHPGPAERSTLISEEQSDRLAAEMLDTKLEIIKISSGIAACAMAQGQREQQARSAKSNAPSATRRTPPAGSASSTPVYEYEIRIWKDGKPITSTMKLSSRLGRGGADDVFELLEEELVKLRSLEAIEAERARLNEATNIRHLVGLDTIAASAQSLNERLESAITTGDKTKAAEIRKALRALYLRGTGD